MGPAYFVIAILGCGEGEVACKEVRVADTRYQSEAACTAATDAALMRSIDVPYPVVVAQCRAAGTSARVLPSSVTLPEGGELPQPVRKAAGAKLASRR